ncbi:DUF2244 domain-containing protein [Oceanicoccus sp. KOV_DT_Chl]|uniref:DUF2244 domain-containing protein n=1 Tax=Oceanicoccus sp. KOV_DT_Chl TaxID=1904639 RepID=UPI000C7CF795|nr:DUF2244 domain-containing protein [Oceanicoccus sp. KOV_DT_Chl]
MITVSAISDYPATAALDETASYIIAQPNQSASWQRNKQILIVVGLLSGVVATVFSLIGAWLILPVTGLEITALGSALYIVCRQARQRHIIRFCGEHLIIEKGFNKPQQFWRLDKAQCRLLVQRPAHSWESIHLEITHTNAVGESLQISLGEFLNRADSEQLLATLRQQGLAVRNDSYNVEQAI